MCQNSLPLICLLCRAHTNVTGWLTGMCVCVAFLCFAPSHGFAMVSRQVSGMLLITPGAAGLEPVMRPVYTPQHFGWTQSFSSGKAVLPLCDSELQFGVMFKASFQAAALSYIKLHVDRTVHCACTHLCIYLCMGGLWKTPKVAAL